MAAKREQILWATVWKVAKELELSYGLKPMLSASVLIFNKLPSDMREKLVSYANPQKSEPLENLDNDQEFQYWMQSVLDATEAIPSKKKSSRKAKSAKSG